MVHKFVAKTVDEATGMRYNSKRGSSAVMMLSTMETQAVNEDTLKK